MIMLAGCLTSTRGEVGAGVISLRLSSEDDAHSVTPLGE